MNIIDKCHLKSTWLLGTVKESKLKKTYSPQMSIDTSAKEIIKKLTWQGSSLIRHWVSLCLHWLNMDANYSFDATTCCSLVKRKNKHCTEKLYDSNTLLVVTFTVPTFACCHNFLSCKYWPYWAPGPWQQDANYGGAPEWQNSVISGYSACIRRKKWVIFYLR